MLLQLWIAICIIIAPTFAHGEEDSHAQTISWSEARHVSLEALSAFESFKQLPARLRMDLGSTFADLVSTAPGIRRIEEAPLQEHVSSGKEDSPKGASAGDCLTRYPAQVEYMDDRSRKVFVDSDNKEIVSMWDALLKSKGEMWKIVRDASVADVVIVFKHGSFQSYPERGMGKTKLISALRDSPALQAGSLSLLMARRQDQIRLANGYFKAYGCSWNDIAGHTESYFLEDTAQCQSMFSKQDTAERKRPWLIKDASRVDCHLRGSTCMYMNPFPEVVVGTKALRKRFGTCQGSGKGKLLERAVAAPLLVHSKRFKIHSFLLVASTMPWVVFVHPGLVTLSSKRTGEDGAVGATVKSTEQLRQESTNVFNHRSVSTEVLWSFDRFVRYLDTYEYCKIDSTCQLIWQSIKDMASSVVEASVPNMKPKKGRFQLFQLSFWMTDSLHVVWSHGQEDVSLLYYVARLSRTATAAYAQRVLNSSFDLAEAVQVFPQHNSNFSDTSSGWELIKHEYWDKHCKHKETENPCFRASHKSLIRETSAQGSPRDAASSTSSERNENEEHDAVAEEISVTTDGKGQGLPSDTVMTSPAIKLDMKRRN